MACFSLHLTCLEACNRYDLRPRSVGTGIQIIPRLLEETYPPVESAFPLASKLRKDYQALHPEVYRLEQPYLQESFLELVRQLGKPGATIIPGQDGRVRWICRMMRSAQIQTFIEKPSLCWFIKGDHLFLNDIFFRGSGG